MVRLLFLVVLFPTLAQGQLHEAHPVLSSSQSFFTTERAVLPAPLMPARGSFKVPGLSMQRAGSTMTGIGGAMLVGGLILFYQGGKDYDPGTGRYTSGKRAGGFVMAFVGTAIAIPGVIMWRVGTLKYNRYVQEQDRAALRWQGTSLSLNIRL